ncbi:hypothetical protein QC823_01610 [Halomonas vilamensis]|uniref:Uncharacterized protein n=1 Tax=Vreelandella vilamensis TaxID=531309 RepID=A0ABU1H059_9GAMM|nr:hypothetical protein [Halomonas vilamensis]MDR5897694.1 hypothetical protein [Halomonas vilamensis]
MSSLSDTQETSGTRKEEARNRPVAIYRAVGMTLCSEASCLIERIFDLTNVRAQSAREGKVSSLFNEIESGGLQHEHDVKIIKLIQGKKAYAEQQENYANQALRFAISVQVKFKQCLAGFEAASGDRLDTSAHAVYAQMLADMMEAQRHFSALEILNNLNNRSFTQRASKGGHSQIKPPSQKEEQQLLEVIVKSIFYNDLLSLRQIKKGKPDQLAKLAHDWAERIYAVNREFKFLTIHSLDQLKGQVHTLLLKRLKFDKDLSASGGGAYRAMPRVKELQEMFDASRTDQTAKIEAEIARDQGRVEGLQLALVHQLQAKFGEVNESQLQKIRLITEMEALSLCFERLDDTGFLEDVLKPGNAESLSSSD